MIIEKISPTLYNALGIFLPLIAVNCAILGGALFMQERAYNNIGEAVSFALGSGCDGARNRPEFDGNLYRINGTR